MFSVAIFIFRGDKCPRPKLIRAPTLPWFSHIHPSTRSFRIFLCITPASSIETPCSIELANIQASNCVHRVVTVNILGWSKCLSMNNPEGRVEHTRFSYVFRRCATGRHSVHTLEGIDDVGVGILCSKQ